MKYICWLDYKLKDRVKESHTSKVRHKSFVQGWGLNHHCIGSPKRAVKEDNKVVNLIRSLLIPHWMLPRHVESWNILKIITTTRLYNFDPHKPHFYIAKLGFPGVYIIFFISAQKHRLWFVLRFCGPVNPVGSCRARSVYLTTRLLGRLSPLSG